MHGHSLCVETGLHQFAIRQSKRRQSLLLRLASVTADAVCCISELPACTVYPSVQDTLIVF